MTEKQADILTVLSVQHERGEKSSLRFWLCVVVNSHAAGLISTALFRELTSAVIEHYG